MRALDPMLFVLAIGLLLLVGLGTVVFVLLRSRGQSVRPGAVARGLLGALWLLPPLAATGFVVARSIPHFSDHAAEVSSYDEQTELVFYNGSERIETRLGRPIEIQSKPWPTPGEAVRDAEQRALRLIDTAFRPEYPYPLAWRMPRIVLERAIAEQSVEQGQYGTETTAFPMHVAHLTLDLSPSVRNAYAEAWHARISQVRLIALGGLVALAVVIVTVAAVYFRLDQSTEGRYRAGLKLAAVSLIVAGALTLARLSPFKTPQEVAPAAPGDRIAANVH